MVAQPGASCDTALARTALPCVCTGVPGGGARPTSDRDDRMVAADAAAGGGRASRVAHCFPPTQTRHRTPHRPMQHLIRKQSVRLRLHAHGVDGVVRAGSLPKGSASKSMGGVADDHGFGW